MSVESTLILHVFRPHCGRKTCSIWIGGYECAGVGRGDGSTSWGGVSWTHGFGGVRCDEWGRKTCGIWIV
ncbi:unnamed protein product [Chondrus crispus]|uniref:Uncharacterized protein n=1 Tax=Chondrus crispus TaxID=2769 RepID=R7QFS5_CHOCR|nr:unnamed protein product [Chondrus crispus]CDF36608.1 unnamed protein product [Chondrus crispus]|eukprot:XP_005716427.1 unnamed protein product [Chondrus crispus]